MSYATVTQTLFQGIGGFAVAQLLVPRSLFDQKYAAEVQRQRAHQRELESKPPLEQNVRRFFTTIQSLSGAPPSYRTLPQDISHLSEEYRTLWTAGVAMIVFCGGAMAMVGAGAAVAFMGDDGSRRYTKAKQWLDKIGTGGG